jgi:hypothetical protein
LALDVTAVGGGLIEDVIARLNQPRSFELTQKIAGADQTCPFIDNGAPFHDIAVLEQQQCFRGGIEAKEPLQGFNGRLPTHTPSRSAFFEAALLIDGNIRRDDPDHLKISVDPFDNLFGARRAVNAGRFDADRVGMLTGNPGLSNTSSLSASTNVKSGEVSVTIRQKVLLTAAPAGPDG